MPKWTREGIIRELVKREAAGLSLAANSPDGCGSTLYQAAARIFGSWRNTLKAAGVTPERARLRDPWTPARVKSAIRALARRRCPPCSKDLRERHSGLRHAARRCFGSWAGAVMSAGIDPARFWRVTPWTRERILEGILQRALANQPLGSQTVQPRALAQAAVRIFGSWSNALLAAGLNPNDHLGRWPGRDGAAPARTALASMSIPPAPVAATPGGIGTEREQAVTITSAQGGSASTSSTLVSQLSQAIIARLRAHKRMHATAVYVEDRRLYRAATRHHGSWRNALLAAGLNPDEFRVYRGRAVLRQSPRRPRCDLSAGDNR